MRIALACACLTELGCSPTASPSNPPASSDAKAFLDHVNETMLKLTVAANQAGCVQQTYITDDTEALSARATQEYTDTIARFAKEATRFDQVTVPADQRRQLNLLKVSLVRASPTD